MWGTFLGIPAWHGIFAAYSEYRMRIGPYRELQIRIAASVQAHDVREALPEPQQGRTLTVRPLGSIGRTPSHSPPAYQSQFLWNVDAIPDYTPVPPYPNSPPQYPIVVGEFQSQVVSTSDNRWHEHVPLVQTDPVSSRGLSTHWVELPSTPEGDDEVAVEREIAIALEKVSTTEWPVLERHVRDIIRYMDGLYAEPRLHWRVIGLGGFPFSKVPSAFHFIPTIAIEAAWNSIDVDLDNSFDLLHEPLSWSTLNLAFHGFFVNFYPKIHSASTKHAITNWKGVDIPSLNYEDPSLETIPAFTITNDIYLYFKSHTHPFFDHRAFHGFILSLRVWNLYLEGHFRRIWDDGTAGLRYVPSILWTKHRDGRVEVDPSVLLRLRELTNHAKIHMGRRCGYNADTQCIAWRPLSGGTKWISWPSTKTILEDLERECEKGSGETENVEYRRGIYARHLRKVDEDRVTGVVSTSG
ncbi:hypothetical protein PISMIDRAFT_18490 [Pisolithus microcarpus 441]|uniref:Uncharacterized protein n=1 Tax=Pisolithus microcarpus 441 TaxID=765257 RepID=A0A0C9XKA7_9AGAM|nr:hypothetical protein PISMIDRAFT_18490 [Pisolithus microcarpus 441]